MPKIAGSITIFPRSPIYHNEECFGGKFLILFWWQIKWLKNVGKTKKAGAVSKTDIEKAYDHVFWNFLDIILVATPPST